MADAPTLQMRVYQGAMWALSPLAAPVLKRRLARGKEDPDRWPEKLGVASASRPDGPLIWLHAVGVGEVLALRGLIGALSGLRPDLSFLVTSTARSSAQVFAANMPPRTIHQFLPLDTPGPRRAFLDHWHPDLSVWAEQDLWPGLIADTAARCIPLALVNARMDSRAFAARKRFAGLFRPTLARFALVAAQDQATADHLAAFGVRAQFSGSLKPAAPALADLPHERARFAELLKGRGVWLAAPTHAEDEAVALAAQTQIAKDRNLLLIVVPRDIDRGRTIADNARAVGLQIGLRSSGDDPQKATQVYVADTLGELGLWYRLADTALIGGTFGPVQGHNPWEAAQLQTAILHGPQTANFAADFFALDTHGGAKLVENAAGIVAALTGPDLSGLRKKAATIAAEGPKIAQGLASQLIALLPDD